MLVIFFNVHTFSREACFSIQKSKKFCVVTHADSAQKLSHFSLCWLYVLMNEFERLKIYN